MAKHNLKIREADRIIFDFIRGGQKTVETRAATDKYRKIKSGDALVFICGDENLEKQIKKIEYYKSIDEMTKAIDFKIIMPFVDSINEVKNFYFSFPNYKEKINKFGIFTFYI